MIFLYLMLFVSDFVITCWTTMEALRFIVLSIHVNVIALYIQCHYMINKMNE